ncbi:phosphate ABC transporter substrate-binding protein PstS [Saccharolobus solfataricus]|uniref:Phosphate-binding protein n=2 Tax=Saccharolobus solfataricus TaxID=2287 RepID=A0A0E3MG12_SACSO|nr:phosphate ABC transporter substrate-binding protein PstS [Saccharolobus solfataricus]AKA73784.1 phosphate ABC transporter substrate-binding protein PstS [Saccharolobus solfataricus]AKA76481.1 phosphate ABC transporter substrate-binding protein PstS [Saccharolobus solfataricus]AKA79174.1 phosphate ABC transporter substrate-binding protein PstS [Saccharolobus solfataricus]AZF68259.1 phosphate ABC transporter substrate-binding protein PstS [Saccharolobus solfataricus]AZF70879.1 phosphate ABC t
MRGISILAVAVIVVLIIVVIAVSGIFLVNSPKANYNSTTSSTSFSSIISSQTANASQISATIIAGGSTFVNPAMQVWIKGFQAQYPRIQVTYSAVGSGAGVNNILQGVYDIGATDVPPPSNLYQQLTQKYGEILTIPDVVGAVDIIYNIPGFSGTLNLTADILAKIYLGQIQYWDDPAIKLLNPHFNFPHQKIIAVHRSDGSGTTFLFTYWLYLSSEAWRSSNVSYGYTISWPVDKLGNGLAGKGSDGVTSYVSQNPYSIGYVEAQYAIANNLTPAAILNPSTNELVLPTSISIETAVQNANISLFSSLTQDLSSYISIFLNVKAHNAYPLVSFSWLVIKVNYTDKSKAESVYLFLKYILTIGQNQLPSGYIAIPSNIQQVVLQNLKLISYNNTPIYTLVD